MGIASVGRQWRGPTSSTVAAAKSVNFHPHGSWSEVRWRWLGVLSVSRRQNCGVGRQRAAMRHIWQRFCDELPPE
jgi:hypothetical protein